MIERILIVSVVVLVALVLVALSERVRLRRGQAAPGVTVFTASDCRLCPPLLAALEAAGVSFRTVDAADGDVGVRSVPTLVVADGRGEVTLRRSGRSALSDLEAVVAAAGRLEGRSR